MGILSVLFGKKSSTHNTVGSNTGSGTLPKQSRLCTQPQSIQKAVPQSVPRPSVPANNGAWFNGMNQKKSSQVNDLIVYSLAGEMLTLKEEHTCASGGEGTVYYMPWPDKKHVRIKVYKDSILKKPQKLNVLRERLNDMLRLKAIKDINWIAWPRAGVFNAKREVIGFAMNKCEGKSFKSLYGGSLSVLQNFPGWDRSHLARTALDLVKKVEFLASHGVLINDFNPANFLVNERCEVSFIDCDSYQVPKQGGGNHITHTYFSSHAAPELLKNKNLLTEERNIHQVEFGTAILVFQLLMYGLHPYNYYDPLHKSACGTPEENLKKGRCPLGKGSDCRFPRGNWYTLWNWLTYNLENSFIQTFRDGHSNPAQRVTLAKLRSDLEQLLFEMKRMPERKNLTPSQAKPPRSQHGSRSSSSAQNKFFMDF